MKLADLSKEASYALRHAPQEYGLKPDAEGFVPVAKLLAAFNSSDRFDEEITEADLETMISRSKKKRHEIKGDEIRAIYGHTTAVRPTYKKVQPPKLLYHGTSHAALPSIMKNGLLPMERQYVHLSRDRETALAVGRRHDRHPALLKVESANAASQGICFYAADDSTWLTDAVPVKYLTLCE